MDDKEITIDVSDLQWHHYRGPWHATKPYCITPSSAVNEERDITWYDYIIIPANNDNIIILNTIKYAHCSIICKPGKIRVSINKYACALINVNSKKNKGSYSRIKATIQDSEIIGHLDCPKFIVIGVQGIQGI